jgi:AGZA family xanthine/uracil permease-like MFS transporter
MDQIPQKTNLRTEIIGGITTFFTMAYIIEVNPSILSTTGTGMSFSGVLTATVLLSFLMTLLMGLYAKLPFAVGPGMGINAFFTFSIILSNHVPWPTALGIIFWSGVLFVLISVTPLRVAIARAIPKNLRLASAAGIGIFLTFLGFKNAGIIEADTATFVRLAPLTSQPLLACLGLIIILALMRKKNPLAFLGGIAGVTLVALFLGKVKAPEHWFSEPDFSSVMMKLDIFSALKWSLLPSMISILFTDLFDSISTFIGVSHANGLVDSEGQPLRLKEGLIVDAFATLTAGLLGTSSGTAFVESSAGIEAGARTGLASVVTAFCFLPFLFLAPLAGMVPGYATAPVLILVGALMFRSIAALEISRLEDLVPAYLTVVLIPLTFSITQGILWGFITHVMLYWMVGRRRDISLMMNFLGLLSLALLALQHGGWK